MLLAGTAAYAQTTWLPLDLELVLAKQLTARLSKLGSAPAVDESGISAAARMSVRNLGRVFGLWTDAEVLGRAPLFPDITLPPANQRHLDAMARYEICSVVLLSQFESGQDVEVRRKAAMGVTAMTVAVERLRGPYMATGGNDRTLNAFLRGAAMMSILQELLFTPRL